MNPETIERYSQKLLELCIQQERDPETLTLREIIGITNSFTREDLYRVHPSFDPKVFEALVLLSDIFSEGLMTSLEINLDGLPSQLENLSPDLKEILEHFNTVLRSAFTLTINRLSK